ncbi:PRC-barrel domain-containing protein [Billgrantia diversa]|uniref:PRC-barrel domain-containing protein n=1 Tax=Halomonas sp. MCCC 1A13316 TaxID=2733487 RepID=UPI0018A52D9B|nr:PRC-barrel domain-containing protein [Halomonas sp. MCCC 1A13316]QOR37618.1 PRC-barrel domain-containing protein [Halomonas sp. MCCC 1A13316]
MQKRLLTIAVAAVSGSLAFGSQAIADQHENENGQDNGQQQNQQESVQAQGLYSAEDLMDADVYLRDDPDEDVGEVEDILLDDEQKVSALVIETGEILGMGGREIVADIKDVRVETDRDENRAFGEGYVSHRVLIDANSEDLESFPEYEQNWFDEQSEELRTNFTGRSAWQGEGVAGGTWGKEGAAEDDS